MDRAQIIALIERERARQDRLHPRWYGNQHGLVVLAQEFGEVAKALDERNNAPADVDDAEKGILTMALEDEIVQVAAVCVRWLEEWRK